MAGEMAGEIIKYMFKVSVTKRDIQKYIDITRLAYQLAIIQKDEERAAVFKGELHGFCAKNTPKYRKFSKASVCISIIDIMRLMERFEQDMDKIVIVKGVPLRIRNLKFIMVHMETYIWDFLGEVLKEMDEGMRNRLLGPNPSKLFESMPDELKAVMKDFV